MVILGVVLVFLILLIWLGPKVFRGMRRMLSQARSLFEPGSIGRPQHR
jgi:hypothetical protein